MASRVRTKPVPAAGGNFFACLDSIPDVVYVLDLDGRFLFLNRRAHEVFGYDRDEGAQFIGREFMEILAPGASAAAVGAIRRRAEFPRDRQLFRIEGQHKDGSTIPFEVHASPMVRDGQTIGRIGVCRVLSAPARDDGAQSMAVGGHALQAERMRIARDLRDAIAQIVFGVTADRDASESFLVDIKRATVADLARRLRLDEADLTILRAIAAGASNREIGTEVHLSAAAVKDRVRRLMDRLGARRRAELAAHALRLGVA